MISLSYAESNSTSTIKNNKTEKLVKKAKAQKLVSRLHEIKDVAKNGNLSVLEKRQFRDEVNNIKKELEQMSGFYIYLSVGTIIIILLLILLL
jgi:hypothetical protein